MKVFTDVTSGIPQKTSIFASLGDFILEAQAVQLWKVVLWKLFRLRLPEGISLCELLKLLFPPQWWMQAWPFSQRLVQPLVTHPDSYHKLIWPVLRVFFFVAFQSPQHRLGRLNRTEISGVTSQSVTSCFAHADKHERRPRRRRLPSKSTFLNLT